MLQSVAFWMACTAHDLDVDHSLDHRLRVAAVTLLLRA